MRYALAFLENDYSYRSYDVLPIARDATITLDEIRVATGLARGCSRTIAADVGISIEGDPQTALKALLAALGYVRARRVLRGWRGGSQ